MGCIIVSFVSLIKSYPHSLRVRLWITISGTCGTLENIGLDNIGYFLIGCTIVLLPNSMECRMTHLAFQENALIWFYGLNVTNYFKS